MITYRGSKAQLIEQAMQLAAVLSGAQDDATGVARAFLLAIGYAALSDIREAFVIKARGGTDAMGIKWEPLKPATIANRRVGKKDMQDPNVRDWIRARDAAMKAIQKEFARQEGELFERFSLSMDAAEARRRARQIAARRAYEVTGMTKVQALGYRAVEILRDTGILLNSLTPGVVSGHGASMSCARPTGEGGDNQIFEIGAGQITLGTTVAYAASHQEGDPDRHLPQRQFLPLETDDIPQSWLENWIDAGQQALMATAPEYFDARRAA